MRNFLLLAILISLFFGFGNNYIVAQSDTVFWFSAPEVNRYHSGGTDIAPVNKGVPVYLHLTTFENAANITISMPANEMFFNGGNPITVSIPANSTEKIDLSNYIEDGLVSEINSMENKLRWTTSDLTIAKPYINRGNKGIKISSDQNITAYYEISVLYNMDLISLKGNNALGRQFYVPFQTTHETRAYNYLNRPYSSIDIVATDDNTKIKVTTDKAIWVKDGIQENKPAGVHTIWLNKGETSIITPYEYNDYTYEGLQSYQTSFSLKLAGAYIEVDELEGSGAPISIITHDDIVKSNYSTNPDYVADQLTPIDHIGTDYAVIQGIAYSETEIEDYVYVIGTQNGTNFTVKTSPGGITTNHSIDAGGSIVISMNDINSKIITINSDKPIYVYHMSGAGRQKAGAIIPAISSCTGSFKVAFNRTKPSPYAFKLNLLVRNSAIGKFKLRRNSADVSDVNDLVILEAINNPANFSALPEIGDPYDSWSYASIDADLLASNVAYLLVNEDNLFHLGVLNGYTANDAFYGYFSNFCKNKASATITSGQTQIGQVCEGDTVQFEATGGISYEWTPHDFLDDPFISKPKAILPPGIYNFNVHILGECSLDTNLTIQIESLAKPVASFILAENIGCAPLSTAIINQSSGANSFKWDFTNDGSWDLETSDPDEFIFWSFPNSNQTDTVYSIRMLAREIGNVCTDNYTETVHVFPEIIASFTIDDNSDITPFTVQIDNISDAPSYKWFWDDDDLSTPDYETTVNTTFNHTYYNFTNTEQIQNLTLIAENELGCSDTAQKAISIYPEDKFHPTDSLWFAVPYITSLHGDPYADITITVTDSLNITNIKITQPYNPNLEPIYLSIDPSESLVGNVHFSKLDLFNLMNNFWVRKSFDPSPFISNSSIIIESDRKIEAFIEYQRFGLNQDIFTLKGKDALGYDFWVPFQNFWNNHNYNFNPAFGQIVLTATTPNTEINITFQNDAYGLPAGSYTFNLAEPGMTMMFVPKANSADYDEPSYLASDRLAGTHITSNKPIAVTIADDSVQKDAAYDLVGDQLVPVKNFMNQSTIGKEYVILKGEASDAGGNEKVFVLSTEDNTNISYTIKNQTTVNTNITNAGSQISIDLLESTSDDYVYIVADKPIYVLHISGFGNELGGAIIPAIDGCRGSFEVNFIRSTTQDFFLTIITHQDAIDNFEISVDGNPYTSFLSSSDFEAIGVGDYYVLKNSSRLQNSLPILTSLKLRNLADMFHLGSMNGIPAGGGCVYGYFSNYSGNRGEAIITNSSSDILTTCFGEEIQFKASGGTSYSWTPTTYLDDPTSPEPKANLPVGIHMYQVQITRECYADTTLNISVEVNENSDANFELNTFEGCSPLTIELENLSLNADTFQIDWENDGIYDTFFDSSLEQNYGHTFINNSNSDTVFTILLKAWDKQKNCLNTYEKQVVVKPQVSAKFTLNTKKGCSPLTVDFTNNSEGADSVFIHYGDGTYFETKDIEVISHIYKNTGTIINKYPIEFIAYNSFGCSDTVRDTVTVYPEVYANYYINDNNYTGCNYREVIFTNTSNFGEHASNNFVWTFGDGEDSTTLNTEVNHIYINSTNSDAVYNFNLHAESQYGCSDDTTHALVIYKAIADFEIDMNEGCSPLEVTITNNSIGNQISTWAWDFDDATTSNLKFPATKTYANTTGATIVRNIQLRVTGTDGCSSSKNIPVSVYSSVDIAINPLNVWACDSVKVTFDTRIIPEISGTTFYWNFKDHSSSTLQNPTHIFRNLSSSTQVLYPVKAYAVTPDGCADSALTNITVKPYVKAEFILDKTKGCSPLTINAEPIPQLGNYEYRWNFDDGTYEKVFSPEIQNHTFPENNSGIDIVYNVKLEVVDPSGTCTDYQIIPVTVYAKVKADFNPQFISDCNPINTTFNNLSINAVEFLWDFGDGTTSSDFEPNHIFTNTTDVSKVFNISLVATSIKGCSHDTSSTLTVYSNVISDFSIETNEGCSPLNTTFENTSFGNVANTYEWQIDNIPVNGSPTNTSPFEYIFENLSDIEKDYKITLIASNNQGCTSIHHDAVTVYSKLETEIIDSSNISCFGADNGFISVQVFNGVPPYTYLWNTGQTIQSINNLNRGTYTVTVMDAYGCSGQDSIVIQEPPQTNLNIEYTNVSCYGASDGSVTITPTNRIESFLWNNGETDSAIFNLTPGIYTVTVTNIEGCISIGSQEISEPEPLLIETDSYSDSICASNGGYINISAYGGTFPYTYQWSNGESSEDLSGLNPGYYIVTVTDINNCVEIKNYIIDTIQAFNGEKICLVSIDPYTEKNTIIWETTPNKNIVYYNMHRFNSNIDSYESIGLVPLNEAGYYIDYSVTPSEKAYKYAISSINTCATESLLSNYHKTIFLTATVNSESVKLNWEPYEIESESDVLLNYIVLKGTDSISLNPIDTIPYTKLSFEDRMADLSMKNFYRIAGKKENNCMVGGEQYELTYSNLVYTDIQTGLNSSLDHEIALNIFPNPFKKEVFIEYVLNSETFIQIEVFDIVGKKLGVILKETQGAGMYKQIFNPDLYGFTSGLYYLRFTLDNESFSKKIIQIN